jgi:hypothetical protein
MIEVSKLLAHARVVATTNITLSGEQTIDGVAVVSGDRVLVARQTAGAQNGIYLAASGAWSRAADFDAAAEMPQYAMVPVYEGAEHGLNAWLLLTPATIVVGTTVIYFTETVGFVDPESGQTLPPGATAPYPNPGEDAMDYAAEARAHVIAQYRNSPRLMGTVEDLVANAREMEEQLVLIPPLDDPAIATGTNLDVTGELVGVSRVLTSGTSLSDANYRLLIAQRILRNKSIGSGPEFVEALEYVFGATPFLFQDLGHMALRLSIGTAAPPSADQLAILNSDVMPRPMAVGITRLWYDPANYFGFSDDPNADGFGEIGDPPPPGGKLAELFG